MPLQLLLPDARRGLIQLLALLGLFACGDGPAEGPPQGETAIFRILDELHLPGPPRFGANYEAPRVVPWEGRTDNRWVGHGSMQPIDFAHLGRASGGGADYIEDRFVPDRRGGASHWKLFEAGFWDPDASGATTEVRIYRLEAGTLRLLRRAQVARFDPSASSRHLVLDRSGPAVRNGDLYALRATRQQVPPYRVARAREGPWRLEPPGTPGLRRQLDTTSFAPDGHSTASLALTLTGPVPAQGAGIARYLQRRPPGGQQFREGRGYRLRVWLKQRGMRRGRIEVGSRGGVPGLDARFEVGEAWQRFEHDFSGAATQGGMASLHLRGFEPGTLWIDGLQIFERDAPPFELLPELEASLREFRPGTLRFWSGHWGQRLENWLRHPEAQHLQFNVIEDGGARERGLPSLPMALELCLRVGAEPWLILSPLLPAAEAAAFIEYLAGDASTPYGALRTGHGRREPWTRAFPRIHLEVGNELWNPTFVPFAFPFEPELVAAVAEHDFARLRAAPSFRDEDFELVLGGWTAQPEATGWGARVAAAAPSVETLALTGYLSLEGLALPEQEAAASAVWLGLLTQTARVLAPGLAQHRATLARLRPKLRLAIYEGGPSYPLPSPQQPSSASGERLGKSLAAGVATLDLMLDNLATGFAAQNFFTLGVGPNWSSHSDSLRAYPSWRALALRNRHGIGDLLRVETLAVPQADLPALSLALEAGGERRLPAAKSVAWVRCLAFRHEGGHSIVLLSRHPDRSIPVELQLPFDAPAARVVQLLGHDPLGHDPPAHHPRGGDPAEIGVEMLHPVAPRRFELEIPPHSVRVLVLE